MAKFDNNSEVRMQKLEKVQALIDEGKSPYLVEKYDVSHYSKDIIEDFENFEGKTVSVAGRMISKRGQGKVVFIDLLDTYGKIQIFARKDNLEDKFAVVKDSSIGDFIGVRGEVFKTERGEISIRAEEFILLSKSVQVLPEKFHGLKDPDLRYRQRYVDLIVNPEVKEVFFKRTQIIKGVKEYLDGEGYLEVETPILGNVAGGANARPFFTHHNALDIDLQLRIANELYLKRLIVGGFDRVYEMGKMFRNEGMDSRHNPEFTSIELYEAYADMDRMMEITEGVFAHVAKKLYGTTKITFQGREIDLTPPWKRVKMEELVREVTGVDFDEVDTDEKALEIAKEKGLDVQPFWTRGHVISEMYEEYCEESLIQPTFVTGHPVEISPLAKRDSEDPRITRRFEAFINGWEFANAFSELNDPIDQRARFEEQVKDREEGDDEAHPMDFDFINAIEVGLPPTGGLGIGMDRMIMLLTDQSSIRDIIFFPTMKPLEEDIPEGGKAAPVINQELNLDFSKVKVEPLFEEEVDFETFSKSDFRVVKVLNCEEVPKSKKLLKFTLDDGSGEERTILSGIKSYYSAEELVGKTLLAITNLPPRPMMGIESQGMIISAVYQYEDEEKLQLIMLDSSIPAGAKLY